MDRIKKRRSHPRSGVSDKRSDEEKSNQRFSEKKNNFCLKKEKEKRKVAECKKFVNRFESDDS